MSENWIRFPRVVEFSRRQQVATTKGFRNDLCAFRPENFSRRRVCKVYICSVVVFPQQKKVSKALRMTGRLLDVVKLFAHCSEMF